MRIALVGAGGMAGMHARCYDAIPDAELVGVMDTSQEAAITLAKLHNAAPFTDFDDMLTQTKPDIVDVCCPTPWHVDYVCRAAERAGEWGLLGISTEKPMGRSIQDCERMITACNSAGIPLFVAQVVRFFPEFALATQKVRSGELGTIASVRSRRGGPMPRAWQDWYGKPELSGGCILDLIIHDFDWLRWTFGPISRVYARGLAGKRLPAQDYALVTLRFESGVIGHVEGSWSDPSGFKVAFEICGDEGMLEYNVNQPATIPLKAAIATDEQSTSGVAVPESPTDNNPYQLELAHFIDCVKTGTTPSITPQDGLEAVRIALAAIESAETGNVITL